MTEREPLAHEAVRESQDPCRDTDHVIGDPENVAHVPEQFDVSMLDPDFPGDPVDNVETFDNDRDEHTPAEPVLHSSSSHWEWRHEYEVPPPELDDLVSTRRRVVAQRLPTAAEEEEPDRNE